MSEPLGDQRRRPIGVIPSSEPPRVVNSAFAPERDARRPLQQTAPSAPNFLVGDPCDLVARTPLIEPDVRIARIRLSDKTSRLRPRHVVPKPAQAYEPEVPVEVREWIAPALASPDFVLGAQPPAQPHGCVSVERPIRLVDGSYLEVVRPSAQRAVHFTHQRCGLLPCARSRRGTSGAASRRAHPSHRCWRISTCAGSCWDGRCSGLSEASALAS